MEKTYKILKLLIWVLAFAVVIAGASVLYNNLSARVETAGIATTPVVAEDPTAETEPQPSAAPDFTVYDLEGNPRNFSEFIGKPVILNFWASWCGPCVSEMPEFQEVFNELGQEVTFLMVNAGDETAQDVKSFLQQTGYTFPIYYDTANSAAIAYGLSAYPTTFFINAKGEVVTYAVGAIDKATLLKGISYIHPQA